MEYKKPNVKGPRVNIPSIPVMDKLLFDKFINNYPEHKGLKRGMFTKIIRQFNLDVIDEIIRNRDGVYLPEGIGKLCILAFPRSKKKIIDFGTSNRTGILTYHMNWDTDNKLSKVVYSNEGSGYKITNYRFWTLLNSQLLKEKASIGFKENYERYIFIDNKKIQSINKA